MASTIETKITTELASLRNWREVASPDRAAVNDEIAHDRINRLLDLWQAQRPGGTLIPVNHCA